MPQRLIFSRFSVIVDSFSHCGIVVYSSFSSSVLHVAIIWHFFFQMQIKVNLLRIQLLSIAF
jgi:hypothetical protein